VPIGEEYFFSEIALCLSYGVSRYGLTPLVDQMAADLLAVL
jgi:hypothetical protein